MLLLFPLIVILLLPDNVNGNDYLIYFFVKSAVFSLTMKNIWSVHAINKSKQTESQTNRVKSL